MFEAYQPLSLCTVTTGQVKDGDTVRLKEQEQEQEKIQTVGVKVLTQI